MNALEGLRVLFLPKNSRVPYFKSFIGAASRDYNWTIDIVCPPISEQVWRKVGGTNANFALVPDFNNAAAWENDASAVADIDSFVADCERVSGVPAARVILAGERDIGRGLSIRNYYWFHNKTARRVLSDNTMPFCIRAPNVRLCARHSEEGKAGSHHCRRMGGPAVLHFLHGRPADGHSLCGEPAFEGVERPLLLVGRASDVQCRDA